METRFRGFPKEAFQVLKRLKKNNKREWFQPRKEEYEEVLKKPMIALVHELGERFRKTAPDLRFSPKSVYRIYRDVRFAKDKSPYKTNISAGFDFTARKSTGTPGFYLHLSPDEVYLAGGLYMPDAQQLRRIRYAIDQRPDPLLSILESPAFKRAYGSLQGEKLKLAPKGYLPDHDSIELLKHKQFYVYKEFKPAAVEKRNFLTAVGDRIEEILPLARWLRDNSV